MKFYEIELNGKTIKFRLTTADAVTLESKTNTKMMDLVMDYSHTTIATLIRYLRRSEVENFSDKDAYALIDELIDNGYTIEKILYDIIFEALVVSGFLTKEQLEEVKRELKTAQEKTKEKVKEDLAKQ